PKKIAPTTPDGESPYDATGLAAILPELKAALEHLGCDLGPEDPAAALALPNAGAIPQGPGSDDGAGWPATGPVAETSAAFVIDPGLAPLLPPGGQEHRNGGPGPVGRAP